MSKQKHRMDLTMEEALDTVELLDEDGNVIDLGTAQEKTEETKKTDEE
jgi:hypothetical protein